MNGVEQKLEEAEAENARLKAELIQAHDNAQGLLLQCGATIATLQADAAKVVHALDCAVQTVDALLAWMPEGLSLSPEVSGCKERLDNAMQAVMGGPRK